MGFIDQMMAVRLVSLHLSLVLFSQINLVRLEKQELVLFLLVCLLLTFTQIHLQMAYYCLMFHFIFKGINLLWEQDLVLLQRDFKLILKVSIHFKKMVDLQVFNQLVSLTPLQV